MALPQYIYNKKGVLYFQRRGWPTIRLAAGIGGDSIIAERDEILNRPVPILPPTQIDGAFEAPSGQCHFKSIEASAKKRSTRHKRAHDLPQGWVQAQYDKQGGKCALTGVSFKKSRLVRAPLAPSIDRLDSNLGYAPENCRLVTYIANCAKNQFTETEFYEMCFSAVRHKAGM